LTFSGETAKEEPFTDNVNIKGAGQAYRAISKACGIPVEEEKPKATIAKPTIKSAPQPAITAKKLAPVKTPAR